REFIYKKEPILKVGSLFQYEQDSAGFVSFCRWVDWTGRYRAHCGRFCDGLATGSGVGAGASRGGLWDRRAYAAAGAWIVDSSEQGVGGADSSCVPFSMGAAEGACGGGCAEDGSGLARAWRIDHAVLRRLDASCTFG